ncbi:hypothetical protein [Tautonia rosea]|uniref:hypothetical protein n=1 Tax=Tautonia rosea TaxID=2728037 RepID=UPI001473BFC6|nr:hypothetical protein [Tautonia rosea]
MNMHRSNLLLLSGIVCFLVSTDKCLAEVTIETPAEDAQIIVGPNDTTFDIEIEFKSETGDGRFRASIVFEGLTQHSTAALDLFLTTL